MNFFDRFRRIRSAVSDLIMVEKRYREDLRGVQWEKVQIQQGIRKGILNRAKIIELHNRPEVKAVQLAIRAGDADQMLASAKVLQAYAHENKMSVDLAALAGMRATQVNLKMITQARSLARERLVNLVGLPNKSGKTKT